MKKRVTVLMGGTSAEREVSLDSGNACADALKTAGYSVELFEVTGDIAALVAALTPKPDIIFNALHGRWGEDGCVQGLLELIGVPYTHSGVLASALAMHKQRAKQVVGAAGVTSPQGLVVTRDELLAKDPLPRPFVVKPVSEGSSVGVKIVRKGDNEPILGTEPWSYGIDLLVEPYIPGRELTVAVMGNRSLEVTEIVPRVGFYDYRAKYTEGHADHVVPADVPHSVRQAALDAALAAHDALGCRGVSRSDFRYDDTEKTPGALFYLETNTQPGMTALSLVPEQAAHVGISFPDLCSWMVEHAACDV